MPSSWRATRRGPSAATRAKALFTLIAVVLIAAVIAAIVLVFRNSSGRDVNQARDLIADLQEEDALDVYVSATSPSGQNLHFSGTLTDGVVAGDFDGQGPQVPAVDDGRQLFISGSELTWPVVGVQSRYRGWAIADQGMVTPSPLLPPLDDVDMQLEDAGRSADVADDGTLRLPDSEMTVLAEPDEGRITLTDGQMRWQVVRDTPPLTVEEAQQRHDEANEAPGRLVHEGDRLTVAPPAGSAPEPAPKPKPDDAPEQQGPEEEQDAQPDQELPPSPNLGGGDLDLVLPDMPIE